MDDTIQDFLLDVRYHEVVFEFRKNYPEFQQELYKDDFDVPAGWLPSEAIIDHLWARRDWELDCRMYMVDRLRERGKLVP
jgi:hypothetical protein